LSRPSSPPKGGLFNACARRGDPEPGNREKISSLGFSLRGFFVACLNCEIPLEYKGSGRRPRYSKCKKAAARKRLRFGPFRTRRQSVSTPVSAPYEVVSTPLSTPATSVSTPSPRPVKFGTSTLSEAEKEARLGRPLAHGMSWEEYRVHTGRWSACGPP
jgi:hypothetical protein